MFSAEAKQLLKTCGDELERHQAHIRFQVERMSRQRPSLISGCCGTGAARPVAGLA